MRGAAIGLAWTLAALPAVAQGIDMSKGGPIEVTARDGIEWRQNDQIVVARGDARAVRGDVQVIGDALTAHYRKKAGTAAAAIPASAPAAGSSPFSSTGGNNEIYRLEADGHVKIFNPTDIVVGEHATYDIDQAVLVMTGSDMKLTTPTQVMTARDTMEYWSQKHMAVGRGLATIVTSDGKRLTADVLVGYTSAAPADKNPAPAPVKPTKPSADPMAASAGKLERVEAFGNVEVRTVTETITGDRGVYVADTGMSRIAGHVHITRGLSHLNGDEALVNMRTGVSTLVRTPGARVQGLIVPNDANGGAGAATPGKPPQPSKP